MKYTFKAMLWKYRPENPEETIGAWIFVTVPQKYTEEIKHSALPVKKGFGSIRVEVTMGSSTWKTSLFPDTKSDTYLLPIKKEIRRHENTAVGDTVLFELQLIWV